MTTMDLGTEMHGLGVAIGLLDEQDNLRPEWFSDPLTKLKRILVDPVQLSALLDVIEGVLPQDEDGPETTGETWHPLIRDDSSPVQLFLTLLRGPDGDAELGLAGRVRCATTGITANITFKAGLVRVAGGALSSVAGTVSSPMRISFTIQFSQNDLGFDSISIDARIAPLATPSPTADLRIEVGVRDADGHVQPTLIDPAHLDAGALNLLSALLQHHLVALADEASTPAPLANLARHLLPVLGLGGDLPRLQLERFPDDPNVLREWLDRLQGTTMSDQRPAIVRWLEHVAGLFGASAPGGSGTPADPWTVHVAPVGTGGIDLTFALRTVGGGPELLVGAQMDLDSAQVRAQLAATLLALPLTGTAEPQVLPLAAAMIRAPRDSTTELVTPPTDQLKVGALRAGISWDGVALRPLLELSDVKLAGVPYDVVDLSNIDSAQAALATAARDAMSAAFGDSGPGRHLAALAGLVPPVGDPSSPLADPARLVSAPTRELARLHRSLLSDPTRGWRGMFASLGGLLGPAGTPSGAGTPEDPWRMEIASADPVTLELAAWTAAPVTTDPIALRIGLRASVARQPLDISWLAELVAVDLPAGAAASVTLMAGQHARLTLTGPFALDPVAGLALGFHDAEARLDWRPGERLAPAVHFNGIELSQGGSSVQLPTLTLPPVGVDATLPDLGLGVPVADLFTAVRILLSRLALSSGGTPAFTLAGLLGLHGQLPGLPADWPLLSLPSGGGLDGLLTNPLEPLRLWLGRILSEVSADGTPFTLHALGRLGDLLRGSLPEIDWAGLGPSEISGLETGIPDLGAEVGGSGTYDHPWRLGLSDTGHTQLLGWLEPAGPPASWAQAVDRLAAASSDPNDLATLAARLQSFAPELCGTFAALGLAGSGPGGPFAPLAELDGELGAGDGVVPLSAQLPDSPLWTIGADIVEAAHQLLPSHPSAIGQILAQLDVWQPAADRVALFIGPPFADHTSWSACLAAAGGAVPGAHFDLRSAPEPAVAPLDAVTAVAAHYTADLVDSGGDLSEVTAQLDAVVRRIRVLRGGRAVILVAHSTAGLAARAYAAANPALVGGLITLGTPHGPAPLTALTTAEGGEALRAVQRLLTTAGVTGSLPDAVAHLTNVLDGWAPGAAVGSPSTALKYPMSRFAGGVDVATGGVPALALGGQLKDSVLAAAAAAIHLVADRAGATRPAPTHLAIGLRAELSVPPAAADDIAVDAGIRVDAFRVGLTADAPQPARAAHRLDVGVALTRPGGWLLATDVARARRAELGLIVETSADGVVGTPRVRLYDAAFSAPTRAVVDLADPMAEPLLDAVMSALPSAPGTPGGALVDALDGLGFVVRDPTGRAGLSAEAVGALRTDARSFLAGRIRTGLDRAGGLLGINGAVGGPWRLAVAGLPLEIDIRPDPWRVRLATTSGGADLGNGLRLDAQAELTLPRLSASVGAHLKLGSIVLGYSSDDGRLTLTPWTGAAEIALTPPPPDLPERLLQPLTEVLTSAVAAAGLETVLGPGWRVGSIAAMVRDPAGWLRSTAALGDGKELVADRVASLLEIISTATSDNDALPGLKLPGGFRVTAAGEPVTITLGTTPPRTVPTPAGDGTLTVQLSASIDPTGHVTPDGRIVLDVPLSATWGGLTLSFGLTAGVVSLTIAPRSPDAGVVLAPITLLPRFSGLGGLAASAAQALLPAVLDAVVDQLPTPRSAIADAALAVADALDLHGGPDPGFAAHGNQLRAIAQPEALAGLVAAGLPQAIARLWAVVGLPGTVTTDGPSAVRWAGDLAGATAAASVGWADSLRLGVDIGGLTAGPVRIDHLSAELADGRPSAGLDVSIALPTEAEELLGLRFAPQLALAFGAGGLAAAIAPLGAGTADTLALTLLPEPGIAIGRGGAAAILEQWALPLAVNAVIGPLDLDTVHVFSGGPVLRDVLDAAGILDGQHLKVPLPNPNDMLLRAIAKLAQTSGPPLPITSTLQLFLLVDSTAAGDLFGVGLGGYLDIPAGPFDLSIRFGEPAPTWIPDAPPALRLMLVESPAFALRPALRLAPFGVRLSGADGTPLLDGRSVHLGAVAGYCWASIDFTSGVRAVDFGGAVDLEDLGLPLSGASGGGNPVAASMLGSDRDTGAPTNGDEQSPLPGLGLVAVKPPTGDLALLRTQDGHQVPFDQNPLWIGIHREFGPLSIDQVGFAYLSGPPHAVEVMVDGGVQVGGLTIQVDDLGIIAPLHSLANPGDWRLDLKGLAVGLKAGPVSLAGGLVKRPGPPLDYAGIVNVQVAGKGFSAVGAYSRPDDAVGAYTSLFVFVSLPIVIGGPPYLFITGLGGGAGYNRRLIPPADISAVESFPLVTAINGGLVDDPMAALDQLGAAMPPRRGSFWLAAGLRFTSFALVETTAVAYVALDRGLEIGVLGLSRAALPQASNALVRVELAIKARFSTAEGLLSVQAQLTDNSWLLSPDCQLTGGFAFFIWFQRSQFVLTLGGYHPAFNRPVDFPVVPRLGFHWAVSDSITIKGESYFALTSSCVMAGGRLEASYDSGGIQASFAVYADFLISWDPFHYDISAGVSVSAGFHKRVCFIACVTIDFHFSLAATVHILGPPLHGEATLDLEVCKVTVEFGEQPQLPPTYLAWAEFAAKYVVAGAADGSAVSAHAGPGLLPPQSGRGSSHPGSVEEPWRFAGDFTLHTETRMPATAYSVAGVDVQPPLNEVDATLALAPMNVDRITANHAVRITRQDGVDISAALARLAVLPAVGRVPAALWRLVDHPVAAATLRTACTGVTITGTSLVLLDPQWTGGIPPVIPIAALIDESLPAPIGLAGGSPVPSPGPGVLAMAVAAASGEELVNAAATVLGPAGAPARLAIGLPAAGAPALSLRALRHRRSAPPVLATLGGGLGRSTTPSERGIRAGSTSKLPGRAQRSHVPEPSAEQPAVPRRVAAMRGPLPAGPAVVAPATSAPATAAGLPRRTPPTAARIPLRRTGTTRPFAPVTRGPHRPNAAPRPIMQVDSGAQVGAQVGAGTVQVWQLDGVSGAVVLSGTAAARAVFLDAAGTPIDDVEAVPGDRLRLMVPSGAAKLAVSCLGLLPDAVDITPGPGAVALAVVGPGRPAAAGWQDASLLTRVAPAALLGRGASLRLGAPLPTGRGVHALISGTAAMAGQTASETTLPAAVAVVLVILDARGARTPNAGPRVLAAGATLATPRVVAGGRRLHLFYDVRDRDQTRRTLTVAVGSDLWRTVGVVGLPGRAREWAQSLADSGPRQLVGASQLTAAGSVSVVFDANGEAP